MEVIRNFLNSVRRFSPSMNLPIGFIKQKMATKKALKDIANIFNDFNEYYILITSQNIYNDVREALPLRDFTVLLRSLDLPNFNKDLYLKRQEHLDSSIQANLHADTSGWKIVSAAIDEKEGKSTAKLIFKYYYKDVESSKSNEKFIEFTRSCWDTQSEYDWKITKLTVINI